MKSKAPFMSIDPSGSFANTLVASKIRGVNYLSITHKPGGKPSSAQLARRSNFLLARDAWNLLTDEQKAEYNLRAKLMPLTGYNLFIKEFVPSGDFMKIKAHITNAQIKDLAANPVNLLPPLPAGKFYNVISITSNLSYSANPWSLIAGVRIHNPSGDDFANLNDVFENNYFGLFAVQVDAGGFLIESEPVQLYCPGPDVSNGDSDLDLFIVYEIFDL